MCVVRRGKEKPLGKGDGKDEIRDGMSEKKGVSRF